MLVYKYLVHPVLFISSSVFFKMHLLKIHWGTLFVIARMFKNWSLRKYRLNFYNSEILFFAGINGIIVSPFQGSVPTRHHFRAGVYTTCLWYIVPSGLGTELWVRVKRFYFVCYISSRTKPSRACESFNLFSTFF